MMSAPCGASATPTETVPSVSDGRGAADEAIVLHVQPYRETSLFVDLLTRQHGRLRLLAKGARRGRHPVSQVLRPFNPVRVAWAGYRELPVLTAAESLDQTFSLRGTALFCGFYLCELLVRLLPAQDPHPGLHALLLHALGQLESGRDEQPILRAFELAFLESLGYGLRLDEDAAGQPIDPATTYVYHPEQGAVITDAGVRNGIRGVTLLALAQGEWGDEQLALEAKRLLRGVIHHLLNGRPLKSRELFKPSVSSS